MCGIVAQFSQGGVLDPEAVGRAAGALTHRGPDGTRTWADTQRQVALGHARLSIIDLEGGNQPLANEDESIRAVVNGELYDFERMRAELEARGHRFRTGSDSELLIHLYEEHGPACLEQLRGEFAFVLWDARNDCVFAGRDRFGIKPLHYARHRGVLTFASEAKALFAVGVPARWDPETFFLATYLGGPTEDRSFFDGVRQLPPGHFLIASRGQTRVVRYWDFDFPRQDAAPRVDESEVVASLFREVDEAVRLRLRADVPVACYLSGGLDSCAVLGLAARHVSRPIRAFTLAFDKPEYDESAIAAEMAAHAGAEFVPVPIDQRDFARDFADAVWHGERPTNNANSVAKFRLSRAVREAGVKVVLTGEGSDEVFAGYPHFRRDLFLAESGPGAQLEALDRTNTVSRGILLPHGEVSGVDGVRRALGFVPSFLEAFASGGTKLSALLAPAFRSRFGERDPLGLFVGTLEVSRQLRGRHPVHQAMYVWGKSVLPNFILSNLGDRMEMAHSVEGRLPLLDHKVVEAAARLPIHWKIRGATEKYVLRELARPHITDTVYRREKHPFFAPPASASPEGPLHALMQDVLRGPALRALPFYDPQRVVGLLDSLPSMDAASLTAVDPGLMVILSACLMQQRFALSA